MPVYVYKNLKTGETFEFEQRITESALSSHPQTGDPVKRLIQPVGIAFRGSGFYVTDSRKSSDPSKKSDSSKSEANSGETKTEAKAESKSEAKLASKSESKASSSSSN